MLPPGARLRVSAYTLLVREQKILLCRISQQVQNAVGWWTLPGGGIEFGEHPEQAAVRETFEETGLRVALRGVAAVDSEVMRFDDGPLHAIRIIYRADVIDGNMTNELRGSTDLCEWHGFDDCRLLPLVSLAKRGVELCAP